MALDTNKMLQKLQDFLDSEEGKATMKEYLLEQEEQEKATIAFFESAEFFNILDKIRNWMLKNNTTNISGDDYNYGYHYSNGVYIPLPITDAEFYNITGSIQKCLESEEKIDKSLYFSNGYIDYNEWKVAWISGQGTITTLSLNKSKLRDKKIESLL